MNLLSNVLATEFNYGDYCRDYNKKIKNNCYGNFLSLYNQYDLKELILYLNELGLVDDIKSIVDKMDKSILYSSFTHGYMHNERVIFFTYILAKLKNLSSEDLEILMDAAKYHDIARINDYEDDIHGLGAANKIEKIVKNKKIYENKENLNLLKFIIDFHSTKDSVFEVLMENYEIEDKERAEILSYTFKASDALDRVRLTMGKKKTDLDPSYFKIPEAFSLIKVAHQLNELYLSQLNLLENKDIYKELEDQIGKDLFFHGIGFDFYKLDSILEYGILSKNMMEQKQINSSVNFNGNNFGNYICVACYGDEYYGKKSAINDFIRNSISFCITDIDVIDGIPVKDLTMSEYINYDKKEPLKANILPDERFVKDSIPLEKINNIVLSKEFMNLNLSQLNYMINSHQSKVIEDKINYFIKNIEKVLGTKLDTSELDNIIEYLKQNESYFKNSYVKDVTKYYELIEKEFNKINIIIGKYFELMFQKLIGKSDIKLFDVMNFIAERHKLKLEELDDVIIFKTEQLTLK